MDNKSLCLLENMYSENLISNLDVYYSNEKILNSAKILPSPYRCLALFETTNKIYLRSNCIDVIKITPLNNDILILKGNILRCYSTPLNICVNNSCIEGILSLLKYAYSNNIPISLQVNGVLNSIPSSGYASIISFDCNVLWLGTSSEVYLVSLKKICGILGI